MGLVVAAAAAEQKYCFCAAAPPPPPALPPPPPLSFSSSCQQRTHPQWICCGQTCPLKAKDSNKFQEQLGHVTADGQNYMLAGQARQAVARACRCWHRPCSRLWAGEYKEDEGASNRTQGLYNGSRCGAGGHHQVMTPHWISAREKTNSNAYDSL